MEMYGCRLLVFNDIDVLAYDLRILTADLAAMLAATISSQEGFADSNVRAAVDTIVRAATASHR